MKITPGKLAGLKAVSNADGIIAAAAMDQRGSLRKSLASERGGAEKFRHWLETTGVENIQNVNRALAAASSWSLKLQ
jgi:tagatose-1,6-bisphosphate aldolase